MQIGENNQKIVEEFYIKLRLAKPFFILIWAHPNSMCFFELEGNG